VESFLASAEHFAMQSEGAWLKVAGGQKGEVLEHHLQCALWPIHRSSLPCEAFHFDGRVAVEFGAFIGYTALRLGSKSQGQIGASGHTAPLLSIEADPVHTLISRHFIDYMQLAQVIELRPGMVRDVMPSLLELFGGSALAFVFMDQKGTSFHIDNALLDRLSGWTPGATVVADNVLRPGAPLYVWGLALARCGFERRFWSMPEFLEEAMGVEDWMAVANIGMPRLFL
jgi:predicted O-methyltransferase YrrM